MCVAPSVMCVHAFIVRCQLLPLMLHIILWGGGGPDGLMYSVGLVTELDSSKGS